MAKYPDILRARVKTLTEVRSMFPRRTVLAPSSSKPSAIYSMRSFGSRHLFAHGGWTLFRLKSDA